MTLSRREALLASGTAVTTLSLAAFDIAAKAAEPAKSLPTRGIPIVDCHHHLWLQPSRYLIDEFSADLASSPDVVATVYVECGSMYRTRGPQALRSVGEAEFVSGMAAMSDSALFGPARICEGFVGAADLTLGDDVEAVLDALMRASGDRLKGIRNDTTWDADPSVNGGARPFGPKELMLNSRFRAGFSRLAPRGLVYDAWQYHTQLPDVGSLADAFPNATIVVNHCGGLLAVGPYARPETFDHWRRNVIALASRPNIVMKLGGLGPRRAGFGYEKRAAPPTIEELAKDWKPYIETCVENFSPTRCMIESNFPVDRNAGSYHTVMEALKRTVEKCSDSEKTSLFSETARRVYKLT